MERDRITHGVSTGRPRVRPGRTTASVAIACASAALGDLSVEDLPPLYDYVDPEALDTLVPDGEDVSVSIAVREYVVEITDVRVTGPGRLSTGRSS